MSGSITNIASVSATYTMPVWPCGTVVAVKDNKGTGADDGDLLWTGCDSGSSGNSQLYGRQEGGSNTAIGAAFVTTYGPVMSMCQTSDGALHMLTASSSYGVVYYSRLTLTRDAAGHVTGRTVAITTGALPNPLGAKTVGIDTRLDISVVFDAGGTEKLLIAALVDNGNSSNNYIAYACVSSNITPTAAATSWNNLAGTNNACTTLGSSSTIGSYYYHIRGIQNPSTKDVYFFWGQAQTGDSDNGTSSRPLQYASMPTSGNWWGSLTSWTTIGDHESNAPASFMCVSASSEAIIVFWHRPSTGLRIDRIDSTGALIANHIAAPSWTAGTNNTGSMVQGVCQISSDGTRFWGCVHTYSPSQDLRWLEYDGGWTVTQDPRYSAYVNGTDYPALLGSSGWKSGVAVLHSTRQGVYTSPTEFGMYAGATVNTVTGTQSADAPSQSTALFQDITLVIGVQNAEAAQEYSSSQQNAVPVWVGTGDFGNGTNTATPFPLPTTWQNGATGLVVGDTLIALCESANQAVTVSDAAGGAWSQLANSPQGTGTAGGTSATRLTAFVSQYNGTQTQPSFICSGGNHINGCIVAVRGCDPYGPVHLTTGAIKSTSSTTTSIAGSTTTVNNCLVIAAASRMDDSSAVHYSGWTNSALSNIVEIADGGGTGGNGGGIGACCGGLATAGTYGATTATNTTTTTAGYMTIVLKGLSAGSANIVHATQAAAAAVETETLSSSGDSSSVAGSQTADAATQTESSTQPASVSGQGQGPAATETTTLLQPSSVTGAQSAAQATQTDAVSQSSSVAAQQQAPAASESDTILQPSSVTCLQSGPAATQTEPIWQQFVAGQQQGAAATEVDLLAQGSIVEGAQPAPAATQAEPISQQIVSGSQGAAQASQSETLQQTSSVTLQQSTVQPMQTETLLQTNTVQTSEGAPAAVQTDNVTQGSAVNGAQQGAAATETEVITQPSRVVPTQVAAQPSHTEAIWQYSTVAGAQVTTPPVHSTTLLQVSSVSGQQLTTQPSQVELLQQGALVEPYESTDDPDQLATLTQPSNVAGWQSTDSPEQFATISSSSLVTGTQLPPAAIESCVITTYQQNFVFGSQVAPAPSEWCAITTAGPTRFPMILTRMVRVPPLRSRKRVV